MAEDRRRAKGFLPGCAQPYPWQRGRSSMAAPVEGARETLTANVRGRGEVVNGQEGGVGDGVGGELPARRYGARGGAMPLKKPKRT